MLQGKLTGLFELLLVAAFALGVELLDALEEVGIEEEGSQFFEGDVVLSGDVVEGEAGCEEGGGEGRK